MLWSASKQSHVLCGDAAMHSEGPRDIASQYRSRIRWRV
jgi:hypothetical protein